MFAAAVRYRKAPVESKVEHLTYNLLSQPPVLSHPINKLSLNTLNVMIPAAKMEPLQADKRMDVKVH